MSRIVSNEEIAKALGWTEGKDAAPNLGYKWSRPGHKDGIETVPNFIGNLEIIAKELDSKGLPWGIQVGQGLILARVGKDEVKMTGDLSPAMVLSICYMVNLKCY